MIKKFVLLFVLLFFIDLNLGVNYKWNNINQNVNIPFSDIYNWNPIGLPNNNDNALIDNGGYSTINDAQEVYSISIKRGTIYLLYSLKVNETMLISGLESNLLMAFDSLLITKNLILENGLITVPNLYDNDGFIYHDGSIGHSNITLKLGSLINVDQKASLFFYNTIMNIFDDSAIIIYQDSKFLSENGNLNLYDRSFIECNGSVIFLQSFNANNNSELIFRSSNITSFKDSSLNNYSQIRMYSNLYLSTGLVMNDNSTMYIFDDSRVLLAGNMYLNDNSTLVCQGTNASVYILDNYLASNTSLFVSKGCGLTVNGHATFEITYLENGVFLIYNLAILKNETPVFSSIIAINGTLIVENTGVVSLVNSIAVSHGDFNIYGLVEGYNSYIQINNGNLNLFENSTFLMESSNITLLRGIVQASIGSNIKLVNTSLSILNGGRVQSQGDFFIDENSGVNNIGTIEMYSNIYFKNNSNDKTNSVSVTNDIGGIFNVEKSISINVALINSGGLINVNNNNSLFIYDFNQLNGASNFKLNGGILKSDNLIKINGGIISGNGIINQSLLHTNGEFGGSNSTTTIDITGDYNSTENSKIILTINSLDQFSKINIANYVDIQSLIEIRINELLLSNLFPNIFKFNNSVNPSSTSSSSSSSSSSSNNDTSLNIINFNSKSNSSFNNIIIKSYSPNTGKENEINSKCISSKSSSSSLSLLFNRADNECSGNTNSSDGSNENNTNNNNKLSTGAIVGIVISCVFVAVLVISIVHYRERIRLNLKRIKFIEKVKNIKLKNKH